MGTEAYKEYSNLVVKSVDAKGLLAMKATSSRLGTSDMDDLITLMRHLNIKSIDEVYDIVIDNVPKNTLSPLSEFFIQEAFAIYSKEDSAQGSIREGAESLPYPNGPDAG